MTRVPPRSRTEWPVPPPILLVVVAMAVGALARVLAVTAVFQWSEAPTRFDDLTYRQIAETLVSTGRLTTHHFPVGYPLFLAAILGMTGGSYAAVRAVHVVLGALTVPLVFGIGRRLYGEGIGVAAAWLVALYPPLMYLTGRIMSETLFIALLTSSLLLLLGSDRGCATRDAALGCAVFGCATLVRSNLLLMVPLIPLWLATCRAGRLGERMRNGLVAAIVLGAVLLAPGFYFLAEQGAFVPFATNAGQTFYGANNPLADGGWVQVEDHPELLRDVTKDDRASPTAYSRAQYRLGWRWIRENPHAFVRLLPRKLGNAWLPGFQRSELTSASTLAFALQALSLGCILLAGLAGRLLVPPKQRDWILLAVLAAYTVMSLIFYGNPRIGLFCTPILAVYAAALIVSLAGHWTSSRTTGRGHRGLWREPQQPAKG